MQAREKHGLGAVGSRDRRANAEAVAGTRKVVVQLRRGRGKRVHARLARREGHRSAQFRTGHFCQVVTRHMYLRSENRNGVHLSGMAWRWETANKGSWAGGAFEGVCTRITRYVRYRDRLVAWRWVECGAGCREEHILP